MKECLGLVFINIPHRSFSAIGYLFLYLGMQNLHVLHFQAVIIKVGNFLLSVATRMLVFMLSIVSSSLEAASIIVERSTSTEIVSFHQELTRRTCCTVKPQAETTVSL